MRNKEFDFGWMFNNVHWLKLNAKSTSLVPIVFYSWNILDVPESPSKVQLQTNESCVFVTAMAPSIPNGIITNYTVSIVEMIFQFNIQIGGRIA